VSFWKEEYQRTTPSRQPRTVAIERSNKKWTPENFAGDRLDVGLTTVTHWELNDGN